LTRVLSGCSLTQSLVILVSSSDIKEVLNLVNVTIGHSCHRGTWKFPDGLFVCVHKFTDKPLSLQDGYTVVVCNGGKALSTEDKEGIETWKNAS